MLKQKINMLRQWLATFKLASAKEKTEVRKSRNIVHFH
jgi:hypothetical protein